MYLMIHVLDTFQGKSGVFFYSFASQVCGLYLGMMVYETTIIIYSDDLVIYTF
jgi:hypothetical protein